MVLRRYPVPSHNIYCLLTILIIIVTIIIGLGFIRLFSFYVDTDTHTRAHTSVYVQLISISDRHKLVGWT